MDDLERALLARCDDDGGLAVYVDWLVEEGRRAPHLSAVLRHPRVVFRGATSVVYQAEEGALAFSLLAFADADDPEGEWVLLPAPGPDGAAIRHPRDHEQVQAQGIVRGEGWLVVPARVPAAGADPRFATPGLSLAAVTQALRVGRTSALVVNTAREPAVARRVELPGS